MGQRHQIFIKIANPVFNKNARTYDKEEMTKMRKLFGRKKTTVIPLHHQWLYGRSAVAMLWSILNVTDAETMGSENPFNPTCHINNGIDEWITKLMAMVQVNTCPLSPRGVSYERMHFELAEDYTIMREDFTMGDNNDGVMIIDAIERKYCFMNIDTYEGGSMQMDSASIYFAPSMIPLSAREYMQCYYAETSKRLELDRGISPKEQAVENKFNNIKLDQLITNQNVNVLTLKEVKDIFPKVFKKVLA